MSARLFFLLVLLVTAVSWSDSQLAEPVISTDRAQDIRWITENLGPVINSPYHDAFPSISPDGLVLYFSSDRASYHMGENTPRPWRTTDFDIYVSRRKSLNSPWQEPRRLPSRINTASIDHSTSLSPDKHWLYFSSNRPGGCGMLDIYRAFRENVEDDFAWGEPENLGCELNSPETDVCVIYHYDEITGSTGLFFVSNRAGNMGSLDVFESRLNFKTGKFEEPDTVDSLNSTEFEGHFDPVAGYLWTRRPGGMGGSDIWQAIQDESGEWGHLINLGPAINTEYEEQMPSPYDHGRTLYYPSDRPGGQGGLDIYVSRQVQ